MHGKTATAFLIHGYLGAGKTTLARRLESEQAAIRFTHDEWMRSLYGADPPAARFADYARRVSGVIETLWTRLVALRLNVVLDFGFWQRSERDRVRDLVAALGGRAVLYRLSCPEEVAWRRIETRNRTSGTDLSIALKTFHILKSRFEPLAADEARVEVEV